MCSLASFVQIGENNRETFQSLLNPPAKTTIPAGLKLLSDHWIVFIGSIYYHKIAYLSWNGVASLDLNSVLQTPTWSTLFPFIPASLSLVYHPSWRQTDWSRSTLVHIHPPVWQASPLLSLELHWSVSSSVSANAIEMIRRTYCDKWTVALCYVFCRMTVICTLGKKHING